MLIYLVGFMGSGKTTAGRKLASELNYAFIDLDRMIEETYQISIPGIFSKYDEDAFRIMERSCLHKTFKDNNAVVATGGGTPCFFDNMEKINSTGISVYIEMSVEALAARLRNARKKRPLIGQSEEELEDFIREKLEKRKTFYEKARLRVDGIDINIDSLADKIKSIGEHRR
ncbi:MAG: AAA family ATPase [Bacteroidales bacterium]|nr:AAA family ATPase [Bacteroidales bacterium]